MGSSNYYKLWLWTGSAWTEVENYTSLQFEYMLNFIPTMSAQLYLTTSAQQNLMVAGTPFRITGLTSTNGTVETTLLGETGDGGATGSREILTGVLGEPSGDEKSNTLSGSPVVWNVNGYGLAENVAQIKRDAETVQTDPAGTIINTYITEVNNRVAGTLVAGEIDTGPTISVRHRKDELFPALTDIAKVGNTTDDFTHYIHVDDNGSRVPRINYYSPSNSIFESTDPTGGTDAGRVIDEETEVRSIEVTEENDRIVNVATVRFKGIGSGDSQTETSEATDATSITNFKRRERIVYAPWVRDSTTADILAGTVVGMFSGKDFNGNYTGIKRATAVLKSGGLFSSAFDAHPGDTIAIERTSGTIVIGKFWGFQYDQSTEALRVMLGLPRTKFFEDVSSKQRTQHQMLTSMEVTETALATETVPINQESDNTILSLATVSGSDFAVDALGGANDVVTKTVTVNPTGDAQQHGYIAELILRVNDFHDGGLKVQMNGVNNSSGLATIFSETFGFLRGIDGGTLTTYSTRQAYMFAMSDTETEYDEIDVIFTNLNPVQDVEVDSLTQINLFELPQHTIDLSHDHPM